MDVVKVSKKQSQTRYFLSYTLLFFVIMLFLIGWFYLRKKSLIWTKDGICQHYEALAYIGKWGRSILQNHKIPMWDFTIGQGADVLTTFHYYVLGDPLSLFSVFVPERYTEYLYDALVVLRLFLSGLSFSVFGREKHLRGRALLAGSIGYVFSGYALLVMAWHPFFLNPMILFPLLLTGAARMLDGKKPVFFILMVCISALSNFYFFYMLALGTAGYVIAVYFSKKERSVRDFFKTVLSFAGNAVVGVMMAAVILVPVILLFMNTFRSNTEQTNLWLYAGEYYEKLLTAFLTPASCGNYTVWGFTLPALAAVILLFTRKRKYVTVRILFLIMTGMYLLPAAGKTLNGFSYASNRWGFMYALLVSYILALMWRDFFDGEKRRIRCLESGVMAFLCLNLIWNGYHSMTFADRETMDLGTVYDRANETAAFAASDVIKEDTSFSRYEEEAVHFRNMGVVAGVSGVETYWSMIPAQLSEFYMELDSPNRYTYMISNQDHRTFLDAISAVKYYVQETEGTPVPYGFYKLKKEGERTIYENAYALPLGYTTDAYLTRKEYEQMDALERQQALLYGVVLDEEPQAEIKKATPECTAKQADYTIVKTDGLEIDLKEGTFEAKKNGATMTLQIEGRENCETYIRIRGLKLLAGEDLWSKASRVLCVDLEADGYAKQLRCYSSYYMRPTGQENYLVNMGYRKEPLTSVTLTFTKGRGELSELLVYTQPMTGYEERIADLTEDVLEDEKIEVNALSGTVDLREDKMLCLSIPYSQGWKAYVDGQETKVLRADTMYMALALTKGEHEIRLEYHTPGLSAGVAVSLLGVICFIMICLVKKEKKDEEQGVS